MQTTNVSLECDVMFDEEGELEVYVYMGLDTSNVFKFNLKDIIRSNVDMFTLPSNPPYIHHEDMEARDYIYNISNVLKAGAEYIDELQNKYLDNEPDHLKAKVVQEKDGEC